MAVPASKALLGLPSEILQHILLLCTTPSFLQLLSSCRQVFDLASKSREVLQYHLSLVPGYRSDVNFDKISTPELFLLLRQRASQHLYGVHFAADRHDYLFRNANIDPRASFLSQNTDYLDMAIVVGNSLRLRVYGGQCAAKEQIDSPFADGTGKILKVCQQNYTISVLYQWSPESDSPEDVDDPSFAGSTNVLLQTADIEARIDSDGRSLAEDKTKFLLMHYSAYSYDRPVVFIIPRHKKNLVPVDLAVQYRLLCAILWDEEGSSNQPTGSATVVTYTTERLPKYELGTYLNKQVWSCTTNGCASDDDDDDNESDSDDGPSTLHKPRRIAFFKDGRKLKLYSPGSTVPFQVLSSSTPLPTPVSTTPTPPNNTVSVDGNIFTIDTPFFGLHQTSVDPETNATPCDMTYLCLGTTTINGVTILCILRHKERRNYDDCRHLVELDDMPHPRQAIGSVSVVARLWGWYPQATNLTGLETVSVSKEGTRIAIGSWDRVLVYAVEPSMLCEVWQDVEEIKGKKREEIVVRGEGLWYYAGQHVSDDALGEIVVLKPIVLDVDKSVVWKMMWRLSARKKEETEPLEDDQRSRFSFECDYDETSDEEEEGVEGAGLGSMHEADKQALDTTVQTPTHLPQERLEPIDEVEVHRSASSQRATYVIDDDYQLTGIGGPSQVTSDTGNNISQVAVQVPVPAMPEQTTSTAKADTPTAKTADEFILIVPPSSASQNTSLAASGQSPATITLPMADPFQDHVMHTESSDTSKLSWTLEATKTTTHAKKHPKRKARKEENELVVLTDRGMQIWDLSTWPAGRARRTTKYLDDNR